MRCFADDDEMVDYKLGYFAMVVAVHRALLLIRGEWYPFMIAFGGETHPDDEDDQVGVGNDGAEHGGS